LENEKLGIVQRLPYERWIVNLFFGLMAVIAFQVFIKHTIVIACRILKYAQMSSRVLQFCMWKECIFQTVTMKKKEETIFGD
jgi:hypothetical protein